MSITPTQPCYVDPYYIAGCNPRSTEEIADGCLSFPAEFWGGKSIEIIQNDNTFEVRYGERGCMNQVFSNAMDFLRTSGLDVCTFPTFIVLGAGSLTAYLTTRPFEWIGQCLKYRALNTDLAAKAYNDLAAKHLQKVQELESYSALLKTKMISETFIIELYKALSKRRYRLSEPKKFNLEIQSCSIDLIAHPFTNNLTNDYEISSLSKPILGLPVCHSTLDKKMSMKEIKIQDLQKQMDEKDHLLNDEKKRFEEDVKGLLHDDELIPLFKA